MNEDKLYNKALDDLISYAGPMAIAEMAMGMKEAEDVEFSEGHQRIMEQLFRKERKKLRLKKLVFYSKRAIACVLIFVTIVSVSILSVEAWRIKFLNFVIEVNQTHTHMNFSEDATTGDSYHSDAISLDYIPIGFKLEKSNVMENYIYLIFKADEQHFSFSMNNIDGSMGVDTEDATIKRITINDYEAIYSSNNNINILVWHDDRYSYMLSGNIDEKEMIKIANGLKK